MKELKEIISELRQEGYPITERKFLYLRAQGLLPEPLKQGKGRGKGVKRLYPDWLPNRVRFLLRWRGSWEQMREIFTQNLGEVEWDGERRRIVLKGPLSSLDGRKFISLLLEDGSLLLKEVKNEEELV